MAITESDLRIIGEAAGTACGKAIAPAIERMADLRDEFAEMRGDLKTHIALHKEREGREQQRESRGINWNSVWTRVIGTVLAIAVIYIAIAAGFRMHSDLAAYGATKPQTAKAP